MLAQVMAEVSYMQSLRSPSVLIEHQLKYAMHRQFGRPTFRPPNPQVLGLGVYWAFVGEQQRLTISGGGENIALAESMLGVSLVEAHQWTEMRLLEGPRDERIAELRTLGYNPESAQRAFESRLAYEVDFAAQIAAGSVKRKDLRKFVQMRELVHEHWEPLTRLLAEYGLTPGGVFGTDPRRVKQNREIIAQFADAIPSVRVAVDLKTEHFRNAQKRWSANAVRDIDALGAAVPYCDVVMPDKEMSDLLSRSKVAEDLGTTVVTSFPALQQVLPPLVDRAAALDGGTAGWGNGAAGFRVTAPPGLEDF
ncbi:MAG: hypothetical protein EOP90_15715 [Lysobacteraceae bacterium]|nr:MAG: hypothetical protein EOP90_15715 [Xanthomonadaceae bacterium]